jgi:hypothetical protein
MKKWFARCNANISALISKVGQRIGIKRTTQSFRADMTGLARMIFRQHRAFSHERSPIEYVLAARAAKGALQFQINAGMM